MCELFGLNARFPCRVRLSLENFVKQAGNRNHDGWGLANMEGNDAYIYREPVAAGKSKLARFLAQEGVVGSLMISHVRKSTVGSISLANTHPFNREWQGRTHVFAFNGDTPGVMERYGRPKRFQPVGETDAEWAFCLLLDRLVATNGENRSVMDVMHAFGCELAQMGPANFLYAANDRLYAFSSRRRYDDGERPPGLCRVTRRCEEPETSIIVSGVQVETGPKVEQRIILIASRPISTEAWRPLTANELVCIRKGEIVDRRMA